MVDLKKSLWIIPIFSAIIAVIAILTPVAYVLYTGGGLYFWLWALNIRTDTGEIWFNTDTLALVGAVLETFVIVLAILILISTVLKIRNKGINLRKVKILWLFCGILLIIAPIGYIIGGQFYATNFWNTYSPGFGVIGLFIAAALAIIEIFIYKD